MLTADLIRATIRKGELRPSWIKTESAAVRDIADQLIRLYEGALDRTRAEVEEEHLDIVGDSPDYLVARGLAKLLDDRSSWEVRSPIDPVELRTRLFDAVFDAELPCEPGQSRAEAARARVAAELGVEGDRLHESLYADLKEQERMTAFRPVDVDGLLNRYNLALAQAVLLRATELTLQVQVDNPAELRALYRGLKFHQLMHRSRRVEAGVWEIRIDGPLSLFSQSQRYGVQMAQFLPLLPCLERWSLEATLRWPQRAEPLTFRLDETSGLRTHRRLTGTWRSDELTMLKDRLKRAKGSWELIEEPAVLDLDGQDVLAPDLSLRCAKTGREAHVEVVGYWRRAWLERRLELLRTHGPPNLILCVSRNLAVEGELDELPGTLIGYAKVIPHGQLIEAAERVATVPGPR